jgi:hypothetical protein
MIKETCSCGAHFEYTPTGYNPVKEADAAKEWRREHRHTATAQEIIDSIPEDWRFNPQRYGSGTAKAGVGEYTLNEDFVVAHNGEPCWIGKRPIPDGWDQWAIAYKKNYMSVVDDISIPEPPEPFAKPMNVRTAMFDSPA